MAKSQYVKKGYFVHEKDEVYGTAVVAISAKEAKKIAFYIGEFDCDWIDVRVTWMKEANIMDLPIGIVGEMLGLRRGIYSWIEGGECDICHDVCHVNYYPPKPSGDKDYAIRYKGQAICGDCEDKMDAHITNAERSSPK